ncbi:MAG: hypothetical protein ACRELG_02540 [Gemmataceae bacterium]
MAEDEIQPEVSEASHFAESLRLLWVGTQQVVYGGIDTDDLAMLCSIVARQADHRLLRLQSGDSSTDSAKAIEQLRDYRESALKLLSVLKAPMPEPDWSAVAESLASVGASPLEFHK